MRSNGHSHGSNSGARITERYVDRVDGLARGDRQTLSRGKLRDAKRDLVALAAIAHGEMMLKPGSTQDERTETLAELQRAAVAYARASLLAKG